MPYLGNTHTSLLTTETLNITGNADIGGTLEADVITVDGITLSETIADTVGAMVTSNNETGITVTYEDSDNTLDFVIGTLNQNTTGSAATLTTARAIALTGDVTGTANFDGSAGISITTTIVDDSHNHTIANVDGLQTAIDLKSPLASPNFTGDIEIDNIKLDGNTISSTDTNGNINLSPNGAGKVYITNDSYLSTLIIESTIDGTQTAPDLDLYKNSASPADGDYIGNILWNAENSNGDKHLYFQMLARSMDVTAGTEDGAMEMWSHTNGGNYERFTINPTEVVVNESSIISDFRVESNGDANCLFVDGTNNRVGIGTGSPSELLDIDGTLKTTTLKLGGAVLETVYTLTGTALDPGNGTLQTKTLSGNVTLTDSLAAGESMVLLLANGASHTVTWPTVTWVTSSGNTAPTLTAADSFVFWKVSSTLYSSYVGSYA